MFRVDCEEIAASAQQVLQHLLHLIKLGLSKIFYQSSRDTDAASLVLYSCNCAIFWRLLRSGPLGLFETHPISLEIGRTPRVSTVSMRQSVKQSLRNQAKNVRDSNKFLFHGERRTK